MNQIVIRDIVYLIVYILSIPIILYVIRLLLKMVIHEAYLEVQKSVAAIMQQVADNYEVKDITRTKQLLEEIKELIVKEELKTGV